jgi:hypothetical protein
MVVAQHVPQLWSLIGLRCSHRQWVVQVLTISKLKRWSMAVEVCPSVTMVCRTALPTDSACENFLYCYRAWRSSAGRWAR